MIKLAFVFLKATSTLKNTLFMISSHLYSMVVRLPKATALSKLVSVMIKPLSSSATAQYNIEHLVQVLFTMHTSHAMYSLGD